MNALPFRTVIHADWSVSARKRWTARANYREGRWSIGSTTLAGDMLAALAVRDDHPLLAGFDFPIGLPQSYGRNTGFADFPTFLRDLGDAEWDEFRTIAREPSDISAHRPFYPAGSAKGTKQASLIQAHGAADLDGLRRRSERATATRRAACPIFWTLGGNQVGRGALSGWQDVVRPSLEAGASLWPFDGSLSAQVELGGLVLAETYPAEAYGHIGVRFGSGQSKRRQDDRRSHALAMAGWAIDRGVALAPEATAEIEDGFGSASNGEDRFDAMAGLMGMMEVVLGRRSEGPTAPGPETAWEGWILGQAPLDHDP